ncbi:hypothetical protein TNCV_2626641 [Trichonephila clavipes]|uniref:Uncharacterized protein n=1 Tax=Trichonephila clavipes TaxID=2585209 RepID=A0A8X7BFP6_TRICX|nr:hypothetical protein TNCV_2626641 [Trichonephila clavipes]
MATPPISTILPWDWRVGKYTPVPYTHDSDHVTRRACTLCVLGGYLVASGIEPRPSGLGSDALTIRLPTTLLQL